MKAPFYYLLSSMGTGTVVQSRAISESVREFFEYPIILEKWWIPFFACAKSKSPHDGGLLLIRNSLIPKWNKLTNL